MSEETTNTALTAPNEKTFLQLLQDPRAKQQLAMALPSHIKPDRMIRILTTMIRTTPKLMQCNAQALMNTALNCVALGLEPNNPTQEAWILPYEKGNKLPGGGWGPKTIEPQLLIGYRGLIALCRRSGQIVSINVRVVHANDAFIYKFGLQDTLEHEPCLDDDPGPLTHVYAVANLVGGGYQWDIMSKIQIDAIRARSKTSGNGPWVTDYEEMARKTILRRLFKYLPVSIEMADAVGIDGRVGRQDSQDMDAIEGKYSEETPQVPNKAADILALVRRPKPPAPKPTEITTPAPDIREMPDDDLAGFSMAGGGE
jgi:recombination protein RecT